ncbi:MAG: VOC family protein [Saprospiraceae bacterium]|nr:VOC family protein [Saprospiraceae bacterium]
MKSAFLKPLHVGISVANMEESIHWYQDKLDFDLMWCKHFPELKTKIAFLKHGNFEVELFEADNSIALPEERRLPISDLETQGTKHIAFGVKNIEKLFKRFRTEGVDIVFGPVESPPKDAIFGFIRDNSGVLIEIIEKK